MINGERGEAGTGRCAGKNAMEGRLTWFMDGIEKDSKIKHLQVNMELASTRFFRGEG